MSRPSTVLHVSRSQFQILDGSLVFIDLNDIADIERPIDGQKDTRQKVFGDVLEGKTDDDGRNSRSGQQTRGEIAEAEHLKRTKDAEQVNKPLADLSQKTGHEAVFELVLDPVDENPAECLADENRHQQNQDGGQDIRRHRQQPLIEIMKGIGKGFDHDRLH